MAKSQRPVGMDKLSSSELVKILVILNLSGCMLTDIFRFWFHSFEVYSSIYSTQMIGNSPDVSNFNQLNLKLNQFICN